MARPAMILWLAVLLQGPPAFAADPLEATLSTCWSCHGEQGSSPDPSIPIIWGQQRGYLEKQLRDFADGTRDSQIMSSMAESIRPSDVARSAALIASKPWPKKEATAVEIAEPPSLSTCKACHGEYLLGGQSAEGTAPRLAGQFASYLEDQMGAFAREERRNQTTMTAIMKSLSEADRKSLASFLAGR